MEKYFDQGTLEEEDVIPNLSKAIAKAKLCPVYAVSANNLVGLSVLLDHIVEFAPNPSTHEAESGFPDAEMKGERIERKYSNDEPFSAFVFRTIADPFAGRINVMKVVSGQIDADATVYNSTRDEIERFGGLSVLQGKTLEKVNKAKTGDIVAVVKLKETQRATHFATKINRSSIQPLNTANRQLLLPLSRNHEQMKKRSAVPCTKF